MLIMIDYTYIFINLQSIYPCLILHEEDVAVVGVIGSTMGVARPILGGLQILFNAPFSK